MNTNPPRIWHGPTRVVEAHDLNLWTSQGWVLLDQFDEEEVTPIYNNVPRGFALPSNHYNHHSDDGMVQTSENLVVKKRKFLLGQPEKSAIAGAEQRAQEAESNAFTAQEEVKKANKERDAAQKEIAKVEAERDRWKSSRETVGKEVERERELRRKLEEDMGKMRKHVGEGTWKEVIGG